MERRVRKISRSRIWYHCVSERSLFFFFSSTHTCLPARVFVRVRSLTMCAGVCPCVTKFFILSPSFFNLPSLVFVPQRTRWNEKTLRIPRSFSGRLFVFPSMRSRLSVFVFFRRGSKCRPNASLRLSPAKRSAPFRCESIRLVRHCEHTECSTHICGSTTFSTTSLTSLNTRSSDTFTKFTDTTSINSRHHRDLRRRPVETATSSTVLYYRERRSSSFYSSHKIHFLVDVLPSTPLISFFHGSSSCWCASISIALFRIGFRVRVLVVHRSIPCVFNRFVVCSNASYTLMILLYFLI